MKKEDKQTVTKTVARYSEKLPEEIMEFLRGIAEDYRKVKNYVYGRYSGIGSVNRLTPVYDILNEMRYCGLRDSLNLPVVYYELAVAEAVADIKAMWGVLKNKIRELINQNENLNDDERMYIRTVLKIGSTFCAVLNHEAYEMPEKTAGLSVDTNRLNALIRRIVRRHLKAPSSGKADCFSVSPAGYRCEDGGIYLVSRVPRRRVFLPLKGGTEPARQIRVRIREDDVRLAIPVEVPVREHRDYAGTVYVYIGYEDMMTLSNGHVYGKGLNGLVSPETERLDGKNRERGKAYRAYAAGRERGEEEKAATIAENNLGKKKYDRQKKREREKTENYINAEMNRMINTERAAKIVVTKPVTKNRTKQYSKSLNRKLARNFRGYIRERLKYK